VVALPCRLTNFVRAPALSIDAVMTNSQEVIATSRRAVEAFVDTARTVPPARWAIPRAPGKWSPGQVTEHVVIAYEQSVRMLHGTFTGSAMPWYQQLFARRVGLRLMFKRGDFGKGPFQAPDFIRPPSSPASFLELVDRLEAATRDLEQNLEASSRKPGITVGHPVFGQISLEDLVHFLFIHTNHHRPQLSATAA